MIRNVLHETARLPSAAEQKTLAAQGPVLINGRFKPNILNSPGWREIARAEYRRHCALQSALDEDQHRSLVKAAFHKMVRSLNVARHRQKVTGEKCIKAADHAEYGWNKEYMEKAREAFAQFCNEVGVVGAWDNFFIGDMSHWRFCIASFRGIKQP